MKIQGNITTFVKLLALAPLFPVSASLAQESDSTTPAPPQLEAPQDDSTESQRDIEEVVAVGRSLSSAESLITERMDDAVVTDVLGAEQIGRLGDSTVSAALRRVPGLSLVNDKFVYIRGLGERYSASSLNGATIPSPDLTRNVIPLNIFPTSIVESLRVQKAYSAELPANFGGGSVDIRTKGIPAAFTASFEVGVGTNSAVSGDVFTYAGGGDDSLGEDDGTRALPTAVSDALDRFRGDISTQGIFTGLRNEGVVGRDLEIQRQAQALNRELAVAMNRNISLQTEDPGPDYSVKGSIGNNFIIDENWEAGFLVGAAYESGWRETNAISRNFRFPEERTDSELESTRSVNLTGNVNFGLRFTDDHEISTTTLFLRNTDDETAIRDFFNENRQKSDGLGFRNVRLQFEERNLSVNQIKGSHRIGSDTRAWLPGPLLGMVAWLPAEAEVAWFYSDARARTDIPNQVEVEQQTTTDPTTGEVLNSAVTRDAQAVDYRFTDLDDTVENYGWRGSIPFETEDSFVELIFGFEHDQKLRTYRQSEFNLGPLAVADPLTLQGPLGEVFSAANILDPSNNYVFSRFGSNSQSYLATTMTDAVFGAVDWTWKDAWRVRGGLRWEDYRQVALDWNPFGYDIADPVVTTDADELAERIFQSDEIYPAASVTYISDWMAETFQLRFGWSETAVRPDLREISGASYIDPRTGDKVDGNVNVVPASVTNFDVRAEWFFASGDNLTATLFYKDIQDPIEFFESAASDTNIAREIINAESAEVYGIEFEGLKELGFLGEPWDAFFVQGNVTFQDSELVAGAEADAPTNPVRKLTAASDIVANLSIGFDSYDGKHTASLGYNFFDERLYVAGRNGAPDGFEQPFHSVDLTYSWYPTDTILVKAKLQNLLDEAIEIEREGIVTFFEEPGTNFSLSFQWTL